MIETSLGLRQIGTTYAGKEPQEHVADVLRMVMRAGGGELGFEVCLTSRPFTSRTDGGSRPGLFGPGRDDATGAAAAARDLGDALRLLERHGFSVEQTPIPAWSENPEPGQILLAGPLAAPDRWCPPQERILTGEAWRYLALQGRRGERMICVDPLFGGPTALPVETLSASGVEVLRIEPPPKPFDPVAIAADCLRRGVRWRQEARLGGEAALRDGPGLRRCTERSTKLLHGAAAQRLRLSLAIQALLSFRWGGMLGWLRTLDTDALVLADALSETVVEARRATTALLAGDAAELAARLHAMSSLADGVTELSARLTEEEACR